MGQEQTYARSKRLAKCVLKLTEPFRLFVTKARPGPRDVGIKPGVGTALARGKSL
jgi:hypothetical protein